jgi:hypothetical protein
MFEGDKGIAFTQDSNFPIQVRDLALFEGFFFLTSALRFSHKVNRKQK